MRTNVVPEGHDVEPLRLARFLDGQSFFRPPEISVLLRALQRNRWGIGKGFRGCLKWTILDTKSLQITSPNYKTIWISSKHRVVFCNLFFGSQEPLGQHTHFCCHPIKWSKDWFGTHRRFFIKPSKPEGHKVTNYQDTFVFQESEGIEQPKQNSASFCCMFPKEKLTFWWWT